MKKYKVYWDPGMDTDAKAKVKVFTTGSPKEAYKKFLASEPKIKARLVGVDWGVFGSTLFRDHIREPSEVTRSACHFLPAEFSGVIHLKTAWEAVYLVFFKKRVNSWRL